eukprot:m.50327 g.50327  ORF g.50327 m.50327 type:complete len:249 (+) comp16311_c0_seq1:100-846(+)
MSQLDKMDGPGGTTRGWLAKQGDDKLSAQLKRSKKRYFVLDGAKMRYYTGAEKDGAPSGDMKGAIDLVSLQTMKRAGDTLFLTTSSENPKTGDLETRGWILKGASIPMVQKWEMEIRSSGSRAGAPAFTVPSAHPRVDPADVYGYSGDDGTGAAAAADMQVQRQLDPVELSSQIQRRDQQAEDIERTMLEVNDIYKDLAGLVADQGSQLHSIEANINATDSRVEHGLGDLNKGAGHLGVGTKKYMADP